MVSQEKHGVIFAGELDTWNKAQLVLEKLAVLVHIHLDSMIDTARNLGAGDERQVIDDC
jgi:hypothetical protein